MSSLHDHGIFKFPQAGVINSSAGRRWQNLSAEVRAHPACELPAICSTQMEITLALQGTPSGIVHRRGDGRFQSTAVRSGTLWFCPIGVQEDSIRITEPLPEILHLYLPEHQFASIGELTSRPVVSGDIAYLADVPDEFVRQLCFRVLQEMRYETAAGDLLVEQLSMALALHLLSSYSGNSINAPPTEVNGALSPARRNRVIDYVEENLEDDLTVPELAEVACLSRYHFARSFKAALGQSPSDYVATRRLAHGQKLLDDTRLSLSEIAFRCRFSSQAAFGRAFRRHTGMSPGDYRRHRV
ncbi:MAG: AraC family transcriptional regulator [Rhizobium sp.]|nr:AraC family transcriptional regulator [Rhizobium sp.]